MSDLERFDRQESPSCPYKHIFLKSLVISLTLALFSSHIVIAQDAGVRLSVSAEPAVVTVGNSWTLTIGVDYPVVDDVSIIAPAIPAALTQTRFLKFPRGTGARAQTVFEYRFTANRSGRVMLESFVIATPAGSARTGPVVVNVQDADAAALPVTIRLSWEGAPAQLAAGERAEFVLRAPAENKDPALGSIPPEFFMPEVPQGVILSHEKEREAGVMIKLNLILIDADLSLAARALRYENYVFEIPGVSIRREDNARPRTGLTEYTEHTETRGEEGTGLFDEARLKELGKTRLLRLAVFFVCTAALIAVFAYLALLLIRQRKS
jgi:hypothetical protein